MDEEQTKSKKENYEENVIIPGLHSIYRPPSEKLRSLPPHIPKGKLYLLKPTLIKPHTVPEHKRIKPPRFVPFEPYPCAITLITKAPLQKYCVKKRQNVNLTSLAPQIYLKSNETNNNISEVTDLKSIDQSEIISRLKKERDYFKSQFQSQTQINSDIKSLLVAVVGEDSQTKVKVLKEDKLQIAKALLDTMNHFSTHTEQVELLSGKCEVWRSKFLASSIIIEKLSNWKTDLSQKNEILVQKNFEMLKLTERLRLIQIEILKNMTFLANLKILDLPSSDVITLATESLNITQKMVSKSNCGIPSELKFKNLNPYTEVEMLCVETLRNMKSKLIETDETFKALVQAQVKTVHINIAT